MEGSWLDSIPSTERMKLRRRLRSPEAYEKLRERVKGPKDLERELKRGEILAELHFALETEASVRDALKRQVEKDLREKGIETVIDALHFSPGSRHAIEQGKFRLIVSQHPTTHHDTLTVLLEGTVQEKLPIRSSQNEQYVRQFIMGTM